VKRYLLTPAGEVVLVLSQPELHALRLAALDGIGDSDDLDDAKSAAAVLADADAEIRAQKPRPSA
jgi:hypothetical protein